MNTFKPGNTRIIKSRWKEVLSKFKDNHWFWCIFSSLKASTRCIHIHFDPKAVVGLCQRQAQTEESDTWFSRAIHRLFQLQRVLRLPERQQSMQFIFLCHETDSNQKSLGRRRNWNRMVAQSLPSPAIPRGFMVWSGRGPALQARARRSFRGCQLFDGTTVIPRLCFKRQPENAAIYRRA